MADAEQAARPAGDEPHGLPSTIRGCANSVVDAYADWSGDPDEVGHLHEAVEILRLELAAHVGQRDSGTAGDFPPPASGTYGANTGARGFAAAAPRAGADTAELREQRDRALRAGEAGVRQRDALRAAGNPLAEEVRSLLADRPTLWFKHRWNLQSAVESWQSAAQTGAADEEATRG